MHSIRFIVSLFALIAAMLLTGCARSAATGRAHLNVLSDEEEIQLGEEAQTEFLSKNGGPIPSQEVVRYVDGIGQRLAAVSERPELPWEFHVLDSKQINAFALPGGKVFFSRGLLAKMENEAEVAAVLGHEVGHVTDQHIEAQMSQALGISVAASVLGAAGSYTDSDWLEALGAGAQVGGGVYLLKYGRDQESAADRLGLSYMTKIGYNPVGMLGVMKILKEASGGGAQPEWLSTHPLPDTRIERVTKLIEEEYPDYENFEKYEVNEDRFQQTVIANLKKLPPPKHGRAAADAGDGAVPAHAIACNCPLNELPPVLREAMTRRRAMQR